MKKCQVGGQSNNQIGAVNEEQIKLWHGILAFTLSLLFCVGVFYFEIGSFVYVEPNGVHFHTLLHKKTYSWSDVSKVNGSVRSVGKGGWHYQYELFLKIIPYRYCEKFWR